MDTVTLNWCFQPKAWLCARDGPFGVDLKVQKNCESRKSSSTSVISELSLAFNACFVTWHVLSYQDSIELLPEPAAHVIN